MLSITSMAVPQAPIYIDLSSQDGQLHIERNHVQQTLKELRHWLEETQKIFGSSDPIYIRFFAVLPLQTALDIQQLAGRTHREVHLILISPTGNKMKGKELILSDIILPSEPTLLTTPTMTTISSKPVHY